MASARQARASKVFVSSSAKAAPNVAKAAVGGAKMNGAALATAYRAAATTLGAGTIAKTMASKKPVVVVAPPPNIVQAASTAVA